jgi:tRNA(adenine34) deaminase
MLEALNEANKAFKKQEVPVGAIIVYKDKIIGRGHNQVIEKCSPVKHAEIIAIEMACKELRNFRLTGSEMYCTLEPCHMCAKAIVDARISKLFFACKEPKTGAVESIDNFFEKNYLNHKVKCIQSSHRQESKELLINFFSNLRK